MHGDLALSFPGGRRTVVLLAVAVVLATGCGRGQAIGLVEVERFARVDLPDSAEEVRYQSASAVDTSVYLSFAAPAEDYEAFLTASDFRARPEPGHDAMQAGAGEGLGWRLDDIQEFAGHEERVDGLVRQLLVDLDDPDRPVIHLHAFTT